MITQHNETTHLAWWILSTGDILVVVILQDNTQDQNVCNYVMILNILCIKLCNVTAYGSILNNPKTLQIKHFVIEMEIQTRNLHMIMI